MTFKRQFLLCFLVMCQYICAQHQPIALTEIVITDQQLSSFSSSKSVQKLGDSLIVKNEPSLTSLLNFNTTVYFKENGNGMVSSPSFRGTTAQQTAVVWNGIAINSQLNGQTDFNTINAQDYNSISVRAGGGSVIYGSSAIGGTVHLNNEITFDDGFLNDFRINYGSFNTLRLRYGVAFSNEKVSSQFSISRNSSDNDYRYVNSEFRNENGQFYNNSYSLGFGYKFNPNNFLKIYSNFFNANRHFSLISPSDTRTRYADINSRTLAEWTSFFTQFVSKTKVALITEQYRYYENIALDDYSFGKVNTVVAKYDLTQQFAPNMKLNYIVDYSQSRGNGSDISNKTRAIGSGSLLFSHTPITPITYELSFRKEITSNYSSPLLFAAGTSYSVSKNQKIKLNVSSNFRIPTFNDLYWQGAGNQNLKPESSKQLELGYEFQLKNFQIITNFYATKLRDMIRWIPGEGGVFAPENTNRVSIYGAEILTKAILRFRKNYIEVNGTYAYTSSRNETLGKQLIYVPYHKATGLLKYKIGKLESNFQYLFVGDVFTQSDNNPLRTVEMYHLFNIECDYDFGKRSAYELGFKIQNVGNVNYQSVDGRFMPGRNYNMFINIKF